MTTIVNVQEAKTRLSELLRRVERGEDIAIARSGHVIARLHAVDRVERPFDAPLLPGLDPVNVSELLTPAGDEELAT